MSDRETRENAASKNTDSESEKEKTMSLECSEKDMTEPEMGYIGGAHPERSKKKRSYPTCEASPDDDRPN